MPRMPGGGPSPAAAVDGRYPTSIVSHLGYPFEFFNPAQSLAVPHRDRDVNLVCAFPTGSGKTVCGELAMDSAVGSGRKAIYTSPLKALSQEKLDAWRDPKHAFSKLRISILTGDYVMSEARIEELKAADIIIMTSEMLSSKARRMEAERNDYLMSVGVLIVDEAHLLNADGRGGAVEAGLMEFTKRNPSARLVFLSATVGNSEELSDWAKHLNGKETIHLRSSFRPVPLHVHYEGFAGSRSYQETEDAKLSAALKVLENCPKGERFIFFVHTKKNGRALLDELDRRGFKVAFHNADLPKDERIEVEQAFREGRIDHLVATSTLAQGLNLPARRVIVVGTTRGMDPVAAMDVLQMVGRAGRPGLDTEGDAYILIRDSSFIREVNRLKEEPQVKSTLLDTDTLAFHVISGIERGEIACADDVVAWYSRSLAAFQGDELAEYVVEQLVDALVRCGAIRVQGERFEILPVGKAASWFYYSPFDVADWLSNFRSAARAGEPSDLAVAIALTHTRSMLKDAWLPAEAKEDAAKFADACEQAGFNFNENLYVPARALLMHLAGKEMIPSLFRNFLYQFKSDSERLVQAVKTAFSLVGDGSLPESFWKVLALRLRYGASKEAAPFLVLDGVGSKRAKKLLDRGFRTLRDMDARPDDVRGALGEKLGERVLAEVRRFLSEVS